MKTIIHPIYQAVMSVACAVGILVSCDSMKSNDSPTKENSPSEVAGEPKAAPTGMPFEEFNRQFLGILSQDDLMQSALTNKVDKLCEHLNLRLLDEMLKQAANNPPDPISGDHWLLGYNQIMAHAAMRIGAEASGSFYQLSANKKAQPDMRDYASQHFLRTESRALMAGSEDERLARLDTLLERAAGLMASPSTRSDSLPGTTLQGLSMLSLQFNHESEPFRRLQSRVGTLASKILRDQATHGDHTISAAMQACANVKVSDAGPLLLATAIDPSASTQVRLSAIGSLRSYPDQIDTKRLLASSRDTEPLRQACQQLLTNQTTHSPQGQ